MYPNPELGVKPIFRSNATTEGVYSSVARWRKYRHFPNPRLGEGLTFMSCRNLSWDNCALCAGFSSYLTAMCGLLSLARKIGATPSSFQITLHINILLLLLCQGELEPAVDLCPEADAAGRGGQEEEEGDHCGGGGPRVAVRKF